MSHDQSSKNLVLDYPHAAVAFFAPDEAASLTADVRITPVREEQLKERLGERFRELDIPLARVNLPNMAHAQSERVQVYADAIRGLFTLEQDADKRLKYADFIDYYAMLDEAERQRYQAEHPTEAIEMKTSFQQAREEGIQQGEARALLRFLERRFGTLPEHVRQRIDGADADTRDRWLDQAVTAEHVEDALH